MHIWRRDNPICPACGMLVKNHLAEEAYECEETIHKRLLEMKRATGSLQDARSALTGQYCLAKKNGGHTSGQTF